MSLQGLTPPHDITWNRLAYSRDMIDTNFGDLKFPPKWRSSLAVYYYIVPEEETADAYPNSRIVYLRLSSSITGWNPNEELRNARKIASDSGAGDDLQKSIWEVITSDGWASTYWPCLGAIMQIAVYPPRGSNVGPDDYPEIMDFEPKKREIYESVTEGAEVLSGSSNKLSVSKGSTTTKEVEASAGFSIGGFGASGGAAYSKQTVENYMTDTSREARETVSHSTSFSQMYQLFNGYHLGTNRANFVIAPRPHTASNADQTEFNLIDGERKLEGIQDVFLVVQLPKKLTGFCVQASIDTGHLVMGSNTTAMIIKKDQVDDPEDWPQPPPDDPDPPDGDTANQLVVTRRIVQNCGAFDENGNFTITGVPEFRRPDIPVVWEDLVVATKSRGTMFRAAASFDLAKRAKVELANQLNVFQRRFVKSMVSGFSAGSVEPTEFTKSKTFRRQVRLSLQRLDIPIDRLVEMNYLSREEAAVLKRTRITTGGDIFKNNMGQSSNPEIQKLRDKIIGKVTGGGRDNRDNY